MEKKFKIDCLHFNGVKPCFPKTVCWDCDKYSKVEKRVLYIHTGAMGDIVRQMAILVDILNSDNGIEATVCTAKNAQVLFWGIKEDYKERLKLLSIEEVYPTYWASVKYDVLYNLDRDLRSSSLSNIVNVRKKYGFKLNDNGTIGMFNPEGQLIYRIGLDDNEKFFNNQLYADQLIAESLGVISKGSEFNKGYGFKLPGASQESIKVLKKKLAPNGEFLLGMNVGVGKTLPHKCLTLRTQEKIITKIIQKKYQRPVKIILLGGAQDRGDVEQLDYLLKTKIGESKQFFLGNDISSDMIAGAEIVAALDLLLTSDTLALHFALSLDVPSLSWFGPTNVEEIRITELSRYVQFTGTCAPCWSSACPMATKCNDTDEIINGLYDKIDYYLSNGKWD